MQVIGLLGGVASGKSLVARQLGSLGAEVLDADRAAHEVLRSTKIEEAIRDRWGQRVVGPDGRVDRRKLADIVFADPPEGPKRRRYLERLTHPEIGRRLRQESERFARDGVEVVVLDAPLLIEAGWDRQCDKLVYVDAPRPVRLGRALARGWSEEEFSVREAAQESLNAKRRRADVIVDNSGTPQLTLAQIEMFWQSLVG